MSEAAHQPADCKKSVSSKVQRPHPDPAIQRLRERDIKIELTFNLIEFQALHFIFKYIDENFDSPDVIEPCVFFSTHEEVKLFKHILETVKAPENGEYSLRLNYDQWDIYGDVLYYPNMHWLPLKQEWIELDFIDDYGTDLDKQEEFWDRKIEEIREELQAEEN